MSPCSTWQWGPSNHTSESATDRRDDGRYDCLSEAEESPEPVDHRGMVPRPSHFLLADHEFYLRHGLNCEHDSFPAQPAELEPPERHEIDPKVRALIDQNATVVQFIDESLRAASVVGERPRLQAVGDGVAQFHCLLHARDLGEDCCGPKDFPLGNGALGRDSLQHRRIVDTSLPLPARQNPSTASGRFPDLSQIRRGLHLFLRRIIDPTQQKG